MAVEVNADDVAGAYQSIREIDTSKKEVILGHEIGAGAPCLKCGDACTGLELHYWRKICKICKCGPEDHRIQGQDREHVRKIGRLFDTEHEVRYKINRMTISRNKFLNGPEKPPPVPSKAGLRKTNFNAVGSGPVNGSGGGHQGNDGSVGDAASDAASDVASDAASDTASDSQITFEWVPQGTSVETATRYMEMLPKEAQPIEGTEGAESRNKQMHIQLPAHDQAPELCQNLSEKEVKDMEDFVKEYKENAVGIGLVQPVQVRSGGRQFQLTGARTSGDYDAHGPPVAPKPGKKDAHPGAPDAIGDGPAPNGFSSVGSSPSHRAVGVGTDASVGTDQEYWPPPAPGQLDNGGRPHMTSEGVGTDVPPSPTASTASASSTSSSKWQCVKCGENMSGGDVAVFAERAGVDKCWHPGCFRCTTCNELLVDLIYFFKGDNIYCGRHYADTLKPRCAACDELIFALSYTQAEDRNWHVNHFCCFECDSPLGGLQYVAKDSHPYCMDCHSKLFAKVCTSCGMKIAAGVPRLSHSNHHWHADDDCFRCSNCKVSLVGKSFLPKAQYIFCSSKCKKQLLR